MMNLKLWNEKLSQWHSWNFVISYIGAKRQDCIFSQSRYEANSSQRYELALECQILLNIVHKFCDSLPINSWCEILPKIWLVPEKCVLEAFGTGVSARNATVNACERFCPRCIWPIFIEIYYLHLQASTVKIAMEHFWSREIFRYRLINTFWEQWMYRLQYYYCLYQVVLKLLMRTKCHSILWDVFFQ